MTTITIDPNNIQLFSQTASRAVNNALPQRQQTAIAQKVHEFVMTHQDVFKSYLAQSAQQQSLWLKIQNNGRVTLQTGGKETCLQSAYDTTTFFQGISLPGNLMIVAPIEVKTAQSKPHHYPWHEQQVPAAPSQPPQTDQKDWLNELLGANKHPSAPQPRPSASTNQDRLMNISRKDKNQDTLAIQKLRLNIDSHGNDLGRIQKRVAELDIEMDSYTIFKEQENLLFTRTPLLDAYISLGRIGKNILFANHYLKLAYEKEQLLEELENIDERILDLQDQITRATTIPVARAHLDELMKKLPAEQLPTFNVTEEEDQDLLEQQTLNHQAEEEEKAIEDLQGQLARVLEKLSFHQQPSKAIFIKNPLSALWSSAIATGNQLFCSQTYQNLVQQKQALKKKINHLKAQHANTLHWKDLPSDVRILRHRIETVSKLLPEEE